MKNKIEKIRKACIEANPEIVDLKFGCRVKWQNQYNLNIFDMRVIDHIPSDKVVFLDFGKTNERKLVKEIKEIIGRPITLADVLKSFQNNKKCPIGVSLNGDFIDCDDDCIKYEVLDVRWNLSKPLSGQEEETIDFLHKVLGND